MLHAPDALAASAALPAALPAAVAAVGAALVLGAAAGLAVAVPVGPVAVLVLREGMTRGARAGLAAGAGVAAVDAVYATLAVVMGSELARALAAHEDVLRVGGAAVLAGVGVAGLVRWRTARQRGRAPGGTPDLPDPTPPRAAGGWSTWARFVALTAANPLTALVLATVAVGLAARTAPGALTRTAFVVGAGGASLAWQTGLALAGAWLGARSAGRWQSLTAPAGAALVVLLAAYIALG